MTDGAVAESICRGAPDAPLHRPRFHHIAAEDPGGPRGDTTASGPIAFACRLARSAGAARVTLAGELDIAAVPELDRGLQRAAAVAHAVVLDLRSVELIDVGPTAFLLAAQRAEQTGSPAGRTPGAGRS
jgi:ABC-type transporter Mla MlaB component